MKINVPIIDGYLENKYDKHTSNEYKENGFPYVSFPIDISDIPEGTKSLSLSLTDLDSVPVAGFEWIHWLVANIDPKNNVIPANAAKENPFKWTRGNNSLAGKYLGLKEDPMSRGYVGPAPPSGVHNYTLTIYALDDNLSLSDGFWYNEMIYAMKDHILDQTTINIPVKA
ncbi:YbhB/YbcL family Raf kinase inhibitor-like protein [Apilactobacillus apisilvae]|uniref:YbhB/YbcL family Raf kinase inhibitor-like protein n=1 Tax=Apilactobacillus apisilvae TaxID=2923364 RepID=A0ABY4PGE6_9LACO|nr:YbhB/YbcL family Raf kinase inhibitor-like protein [Apilactobacillus apisilvae]UQS84647.1 YbhB/YbcL family Raf kinase inhibitor-like protein [Apilactobacillus apisilvae]